jgi:hypothetical protein
LKKFQRTRRPAVTSSQYQTKSTFGPEVAVKAVDVLVAEVDNASSELVGQQEPHGE